ncbi:MAG: hypothetical protein AAGF33_06080 [Pseudomonadota bacterium]
MLFKRVRLRPGSPLVNVSLAAAVIFLAACSGNEDEPTGEAVDNSSSQTEEVAENTLVLPAVWNTGPLHAPVKDIAFAGGIDPILLALFEDGSAQIFDLNAERLTEPAQIDASVVATGSVVTLGGISLSLFPALSEDGAPIIIAYNSALTSPNVIDLEDDIRARGMCLAEIPTDGAAFTIQYRPLDGTNDFADSNYRDINITPEESIQSMPGGIEAAAGPTLECASDRPRSGDVVLLRRGDRFATVQLPPSGVLKVQTQPGSSRTATIRDGITVRATKEPTAIAALSDVRFGNYPDGVLAVAGPLDSGEHRIALVEPGPLFD